ncbi:MAG TPA: bifunctional riboflavin kinase/FAD synthetase [Dehalococcoidia bacterium]|nr:bifunctional riboflavin kinase/FAD synthetase [Dehalococcoidia bacterium]
MTVPDLAREELRRSAPGRTCAVTIGKFDGVHRGHQHLIRAFLAAARERDLASVVITLHPNPLTVLRPGLPITYLCSLDERLALLRALGPDRVGMLSFTSELSQLTAREFVELLMQELSMRMLFIGPDLTLGRSREGTPEVLRALGEELGFELVVADVLAEDGTKVGSSAVRQALAAGEMERAADLLGRTYSLSGPVVVGERRGRQLGFPTANIGIAHDLALPAYGVYITRAHLDGVAYQSSTNIGVRPTFEEEAWPTIEAYLLDFQGDIYGRQVQLDMLHRLRDELKFDRIEELVAAIEGDVTDTRRYFQALATISSKAAQ